MFDECSWIALAYYFANKSRAQRKIQRPQLNRSSKNPGCCNSSFLFNRSAHSAGREFRAWSSQFGILVVVVVVVVVFGSGVVVVCGSGMIVVSSTGVTEFWILARFYVFFERASKSLTLSAPSFCEANCPGEGRLRSWFYRVTKLQNYTLTMASRCSHTPLDRWPDELLSS